MVHANREYIQKIIDLIQICHKVLPEEFQKSLNQPQSHDCRPKIPVGMVEIKTQRAENINKKFNSLHIFPKIQNILNGKTIYQTSNLLTPRNLYTFHIAITVIW